MRRRAIVIAGNYVTLVRSVAVVMHFKGAATGRAGLWLLHTSDTFPRWAGSDYRPRTEVAVHSGIQLLQIDFSIYYAGSFIVFIAGAYIIPTVGHRLYTTNAKQLNVIPSILPQTIHKRHFVFLVSVTLLAASDWSTDTSDPGHFGTSAELTVRHFGTGTGVRTLRH